MHIAKFDAHPALPGGQLQTLAGFLWPSAPAFPADERWTITLPDGDPLILEINNPQGRSKGPVPILYLIHGLGGSAESSYKLRIARKMQAAGYRVIRHNHRGCTPTEKKAQRIYHSGSQADVLYCLEAVSKRWKDSPFAVIGFSLSGAILLNMLGVSAEAVSELSQLKAAMTVCAPIDLPQTSQALGSLRNKHIDMYYSRTARKQLMERGFIPKEMAARELKRPTLRKIDDLIVAPLAGFSGADEYYERCSPKHVVAQIRLPTLVLAAADDPIVPAKEVLEASYSASTFLSMQDSGGHLGFLCRQLTSFSDFRWLDAVVSDWAGDVLPRP